MTQDEIPHAEHPEEKRREVISVFPASELLLDSEHAQEIWPQEIAQNKEFLRQLEARQELVRRLDVVLSCLLRPDMSLEQAVASGDLTQAQVADLYASLNTLLEDGSEYQRVLLYLPFEFLSGAPEFFKQTYLSAWEKLLSTHDVRANFVDGDVMEVEKRETDLPRVVKAAHLIPKLVEVGFLTVEEVLRRMDETDDDVLRNSIVDTLPVLRDMGFLEGDRGGVKETPEGSEVTRISIESQLDSDFRRIDSADYGDITKKREAWLKQDKKRKAIESASETIQRVLEAGILDCETGRTFVFPEASAQVSQAFVEGVRKAVEAKAREDQAQAQGLYATHRETLESLWQSRDSQVREALAKTFYRLHGLGIVSDTELQAQGLVIPALAGPFSENLKHLQPEVAEVRRIVEAVERDSQLSKFMYPVVLLYGSRLKGYGSENSDIDVAVFVRPDVDSKQKEVMRALLAQHFSHEKIGGEVAEFWTKEEGGELRVRDFEEYDPKIAERIWTYVLFGAAWEGDAKAVAELRTKLLVPYFYDDKKTLYNRDVRALYLEELERDTLQYRLMHKGYEKFYPSYGGMNTPHADSIDGKSMFWDSGYRQMATKLYASRVFLPKLDRSE
ncbi:nucleotidyltransferase domain-containing protein [Candidatus Uhrbacteria bacterium]|nr:nucleotidyltransferase domain-containing protein [Candidatus Uhrbacteria bacterium]